VIERSGWRPSRAAARSSDETPNSVPASSFNPRCRATHNQESEMATKRRSGEAGVYRITEVIGVSDKSWEDAARNAVETAGKTLRDLRIAEVGRLDMKVEDGKVVAFRARVQLSFKYEG
jgi:flavin-binding protein dodecin